MRAKYFLKGMGIGVTVTAIIFTVAFALNPPTLSDEEVIARAKMLGMVETEDMEEPEDEETSEETAEDAATSEETADGAETEETKAAEDAEADSGETAETESTDSEAADSETAEEASDGEVSEEEAMKALKELADAQNEAEGADTPDNSQYKTTDTVNDSSADDNVPGVTKSFTVNNGEDSSVVAARLYQKGIIDDPNSFDLYLSTHGFDTRIHPGSYNIPEGSSYQAIANAIAY